ncbi:MAG: thymidine phosphorylase, partial [Lachnospiraceae bacterium]|nr:thymidine phosphorylase [Lachnospiraceae bacterium]
IIGQSGNLAPADKKLYALRDVTSTVDSIPLITSSVMGKKLAAGSKNIVLDVKVGSGAFMKTLEGAKELAGNMVEIGKLNGRNMAALLTDMDEPLGTHIGNSLEIIEAVGVLRGQVRNDLREVSVALASELIRMLYSVSIEEARSRVNRAIDSGLAYKTFRKWIAAQGGDLRAIDDLSLLPGASVTYDVQAQSDGFISSMNASEIGMAAMMLGAGRASKEDAIDYGAGIVLSAKTGDFVRAGQSLATLYTNHAELVTGSAVRFMNALTFSSEKPVLKPLIYEVIH